MKFPRILLATLAAAAALFTACDEKEQDLTVAQISVKPDTLKFSASEGTMTVELTATRPWTVKSLPDWVAVDPNPDAENPGPVSDVPQVIEVSVSANPGDNALTRKGTVVFGIDVESATLVIIQEGKGGDPVPAGPAGEGTVDSPYNVAKALELARAMDADGKLENVYIQGIISQVGEINTSFGNGTFFISDDGTADEQLEIYRSYSVGGAKFTSTDEIKAGDKVIVFGTLVNFKGNTPEVTQGGQIYSLNGETTGKPVDTSEYENAPAKTVQEFIDNGKDGKYYKLTGKVSKFSSQYCSFDLTDDSGTIYVYSVDNKAEWVDKISNGGTVVLAGKYEYYEKKEQHEVVNAVILSFDGGSSGGDDYSNAPSKTVQEFIDNGNDGKYYKLTGTVSKFSSQYCSFDLTDNSGTIYVYSVANKADWVDKISNGGTVVLAGKYEYYEKKSQHEVVDAYILSFDGNGSSGGDDYSNAPSKTVQEFISNGNDGKYYKLTGTVSKFSSQYCSFDLTDNSGTIYVYSVANKADWVDKISNGGTVVLAGKYEYYEKKSQHEVVDAYILSFDGGGDPGGQTGDIKKVSVADFIAAAESSTQKYQLTGTIGGSINTTYGNFDLTDDSGTVYVYGLTATDLGYGTKNDQSFSSLGLKEGDKITIIGYRGSYNDKVEVVYAYFVEKVSGGDPGGQTGDIKKVSVADFIAAPESSTQKYQLTGTIGGSINETYGNFDLTDDSGTVYVYGLTATDLGYGTKNDKSYSSLGLKEGDKITIIGYRGSYQDKVEVVYAYFVEKVSSGGNTGGDPGGQTGDIKKVSVADFIAAPESSTQKYQLTGTIGGSINETYGNFDLTDDSGTVYVYGLTATDLGYGTKNDQSYASLGLKEGDKITIIGYRGSYKDKVEVVYAYFVEKVSSGSGGGQGGGGQETGDIKKVSVADFIAAPESQTQKYQLTGTIGGSINTTYGNFDLTDSSGTVYVYGLTATDLGYGTKNDKSYASLGLKEGDKITIIGYRGSYNDKVEVTYAYFVSKE